MTALVRFTLPLMLVLATACNKKSDAPAGGGAGLTDPSKLTEASPASYRVKFSTTQGDFVIEVQRDWAPNGADRFYNLVKNGYYDDLAFFRVVDGFMVQFGISGDPSLNQVWRGARIPDDPVKQTNARGNITFATSGANSRTTQVFINFNDNANLDRMGFAPFGKVTSGMDVVDRLYKGYGEGAPGGAGPNQMMIQSKGNGYLKSEFPKLDYTKKVTIEPS
jgi:peptidyl-prolyl cis-trans isomerase A (cyclophilin A)